MLKGDTQCQTSRKRWCTTSIMTINVTLLAKRCTQQYFMAPNVLESKCSRPIVQGTRMMLSRTLTPLNGKPFAKRGHHRHSSVSQHYANYQHLYFMFLKKLILVQLMKMLFLSSVNQFQNSFKHENLPLDQLFIL